MKQVCCLSQMAVMAAVVAIAVSDGSAQTRARMDAKPGYTAPAAGAGGALLRVREVTGLGPRALVKSPEFSSSVSRGRIPAKEWAELTVGFDTEPEWIDEISVQYYALLYSRKTKEYAFLKGVVSHVDVARGRGHVSTGYIRPATLQRYGDVVGVAVEVLSKGEVVASDSVAGKLPDQQVLQGEWWKTIKLTPKDGYILNRTQTPFVAVNYDDYEVIK